MGDFFVMLWMFGPLSAVSWTLSGVLIPGAIAVGLFSITRFATPVVTVGFWGICLLATASMVSPDGLFVVSTSIPFALLSAVAAWACRHLRRIDGWLEKNERGKI